MKTAPTDVNITCVSRVTQSHYALCNDSFVCKWDAVWSRDQLAQLQLQTVALPLQPF